MKITITLEDTKKGNCDIGIHFDPPIDPAAPSTQASIALGHIMNALNKAAACDPESTITVTRDRK